ncbi:MAG: NADH-quinone oxidoreductase subunit L, partial [Myxococcales bacterium]
MNLDWDPRVLQESLYYIVLLPFIGAAINGFFGKRLGNGNVALIACGAVATSFVIALLAVLPMFFPRAFGISRLEQLVQMLGVWFQTGNISVFAAVRIDHLSGILTLVITGVGFLIHVYSTKYMEEDPGFWKFFTYLNLFVGFMLILVLGDNLVTMFVGWEGVGLCSFLLIGFWYEDEAKALAGRKAFVVNRVGDLGFVLGIFTLISMFGSVDFRTLEGLARNLRDLDAAIPSGALAALGMTYAQGILLACLLLFVGATGKSAQLPLYVWLPDAMAGPTPVSALIHAATMVTAGVYMIARLSFLFSLSPTAMAVVATVGAITALFAALMGLAQTDIKKVLAYSTVSQLGFT